jgi:phosphoglycerate dehydrogenase-like enzyme
MKILIHFNRFDDDQIAAFREMVSKYGDHEVLHATSDEDAVARAAEAEVLLGFFPPAVCAAAPKLRWIQSHSAGMDKFLFPELVEREEVAVSNMAGMYAPQGGEHAWGLLLALTRGILPAIHQMAEGAWGGLGPIINVTGMTMGVIGMGGFGMEIVKRAAGYDMTIIAIDAVRTDKPAGVDELKPATRENLHGLLRRSDVVMTACPLTPETYHLISSEEFAQMKQSAYLINVTRGGIIDEPALTEALQNGQIAGAGLDVTEKEPLPADNPLWNAPNLIITPHRAGASQHRPRETFEFFYQQLERYLKGERPRNIIDKRRGY